MYCTVIAFHYLIPGTSGKLDPIHNARQPCTFSGYGPTERIHSPMLIALHMMSSAV